MCARPARSNRVHAELPKASPSSTPAEDAQKELFREAMKMTCRANDLVTKDACTFEEVHELKTLLYRREAMIAEHGMYAINCFALAEAMLEAQRAR